MHLLLLLRKGMFAYLLKRLVWVLPTLWFITSVVFVLSKLIPGNGAFIFDDDTSVRTNARTRIYQQYLERTGQHLPLFYVSIHTLSEPDTIHRIVSARDKLLLRKLLFHYGNWPEVANYFYHLQELQQASLLLKEPLQRTFQKSAAGLYSSTEKPAVLDVFKSLTNLLSSGQADLPLDQILYRAKHSFIQLASNTRPVSNYLPALYWHGSQNQYHQWIKQLLRRDMGISLRDARPVSAIINEAISNTLLLSICSLLLIFGISILINLLIIHPDYHKLSKPVLQVLYILDTIPVFMLAFLLIILLAAGDYLQLFPIYGLGHSSPQTGWLQSIRIQLYYLTIPLVCLTLTHIPYVTSQLYQAMREVAFTDFVTTARAKGVPESRIVFRHILRNSLFPLITLFAGFIPALLGGAVVIEVIFAIPGMGRLLVDSIQARDYPVILGIVLLMAFARILANILADILYYLADPRVTFSHDRKS